MQTLVRIALVVTFMCARGAPSIARQSTPPTDDAARQAVMQLEAHWLAAEGDASALDAILADDFVHVLPSGSISKREQLEFVRAHPQAFAGARRFDALSVRVYGDVAVANGIVRATPAGSNRAARTRFTDVFVRRQGRWQAVNAQETPAVE